MTPHLHSWRVVLGPDGFARAFHDGYHYCCRCGTERPRPYIQRSHIVLSRDATSALIAVGNALRSGVTIPLPAALHDFAVGVAEADEADRRLDAELTRRLVAQLAPAAVECDMEEASQ